MSTCVLEFASMALKFGDPCLVLELWGRSGDEDTPSQNFGDRLGTRVIYNFKEFLGNFHKKFGDFPIEIRSIS